MHCVGCHDEKSDENVGDAEVHDDLVDGRVSRQLVAPDVAQNTKVGTHARCQQRQCCPDEQPAAVSQEVFI